MNPVQTLQFQNTKFNVTDLNGLPWLRGYQIGNALEYSDGAVAISKLYDRNADEFTDSMTQVVELQTAGGKQQVRVFSLRGCHLLGMLARTKKAKEFRRWVLDVLEKETANRRQPNPNAGLEMAMAALTEHARKLPAVPTAEQLDEQGDINDTLTTMRYALRLMEHSAEMAQYLSFLQSPVLVHMSTTAREMRRPMLNALEWLERHSRDLPKNNLYNNAKYAREVKRELLDAFPPVKPKRLR